MEDGLLILLAGVVSAVGGIWLERARARRAARLQADERELANKRALRLLERELHEAGERIARAASTGVFSVRDRRLGTDEWDAHRAEVAGVLGAADWQRVIAAYDAIIDLNE